MLSLSLGEGLSVVGDAKRLRCPKGSVFQELVLFSCVYFCRSLVTRGGVAGDLWSTGRW